MHDQRSVPEFHARAVRLWLLAAAAMIFLTLVIGGATRLTVSGLSIVEWKPVTGVLPPLSESAWQAEFDDYKAIPQYRELNHGMSLGAVQDHLLVGMDAPAAGARDRRGVPAAVSAFPVARRHPAAAAPAAVDYFCRRRRARRGRLVDGVVGPFRHAHQGLAIPAGVPYDAGLRDLCGDRCGPRSRSCRGAPSEAPQRLRLGALAIAALLLVQIYLGALVAGLDAGLKYNTWPTIDGAFMPSLDRLLFITPLWRNLFENALTVQFDHRMLADAIWLLALLHAL